LQESASLELATSEQFQNGLAAQSSSRYVNLMSAVAEIKSTADGLVVSNPGILAGTPIFRGTRLPVQTLFEYLADGLSLDYYLETFEGVTREQAKAVLRHGWERIAAELGR
jgi:uncharacterized protein (DUF433 family)